MNEKPAANITLGLELTGQKLRGAIISFKKNNALIAKVFSIDIDQEASTPHNVKPLYIKEERATFRTILNKSLVTTFLHTSDVLIRPLSLELTKESNIDRVLEFQAEPLIPYRLEEALVDRIILSKNEESTDLTVIVTKKNRVAGHLETMRSMEIEPEVISCAPAALAALSRHFFPKKNFCLILNIGATESSATLLNNGKLISAQATNIGIDNLIETYAKQHHLDYSTAGRKINELTPGELEKDQKLEKTFDSIQNELAKICMAQIKVAFNNNITEIYVTGEGALSEILINKLAAKLKKKIIIHEIEGSLELNKYSLAIGSALTAIPKEKDQINFCQKEFSFPHPWKRLKKPMFAYFSLCLALFVAIYLFGNALLSAKNRRLIERYVEVLAIIKIPYREIEQKFSNQYTEETIINLTKEDLALRLDALEKELLKTPNIFPLLPNTPKVTDVLAWLCSHPDLVGSNSGDSPKISLNSFSYKMIKRPNLNKMNEKYQIKVEITFASSKPRYAREFHDSLLTPNEMIDPKQEVKWSIEKEGYRASFFLKDATVYPSR